VYDHRPVLAWHSEWHSRRVEQERKFNLWLVECERSGANLEIPYRFLFADFELGTRNLSRAKLSQTVKNLKKFLLCTHPLYKIEIAPLCSPCQHPL
jgi:hypothetical protein